MLRLIEIEPVAPYRYRVSFDRDGQILQYHFSTTAVENGFVGVMGFYKAMEDLADYYVDPEPGKPAGGLYVPAVHEASKLVRRVALGEKVPLPVILDER